MQLQFRVVALSGALVAKALCPVAQCQEQLDSKPSDPTALMLVVLENHNGKRTMETTPMAESGCRHAIRLFQEVGPFNITVHSSDLKNITVSGRAIEIQCVLSDTSIIGTHPTNLQQKR
jgi:hypothetical protein